MIVIAIRQNHMNEFSHAVVEDALSFEYSAKSKDLAVFFRDASEDGSNEWPIMPVGGSQGILYGCFEVDDVEYVQAYEDSFFEAHTIEETVNLLMDAVEKLNAYHLR